MREDQIIIGGQAVIEGVMMRAPNSYAVAVRRPDGEIVARAEAVPPLARRYPVLALPVVRGAAVLIHSTLLGMKALNYSAGVAMEEDRPAQAARRKAGGALGSVIFALLFNVVLFVVLPLLLTNALFVTLGGPTADGGGAWYAQAWAWLRALFEPVRPSLAFNLVDGLIRLAFFLAMLVAISFMRDIRRVFEYHGAEHKVVYTWEAGEALTVENARRKPRQHPRCGTSFLLVVMMTAVAVFSAVEFDSLWLNLAARLLLLPVIAGLSYEFIRASALDGARWALSVLTRPGLWLQNLTTREPDDGQLEVAIHALMRSLELEPDRERLGLI